MASPASTGMSASDIQQLIPHRPPFLWLDEVVDVGERTIHARKYLSPKLDVFQGHYPGQPVFPGVLQCEAAMQAGAVLIARQQALEEGFVPVATRINNVQFRRIVLPGQTLDLKVELTERLGSAWFLKGTVSVEGSVTARLEFACAAAPENATRPTQQVKSSEPTARGRS